MYYAAATFAWIEWYLDGGCCGGVVDFDRYHLFFAESKESLPLLNFDFVGSWPTGVFLYMIKNK